MPICNTPLALKKKDFRSAQSFVIEGGASKGALTILDRTAGRLKGPVFLSSSLMICWGHLNHSYSGCSRHVSNGADSSGSSDVHKVSFHGSALPTDPRVHPHPHPSVPSLVIKNNLLALPLWTNEARGGIHHRREGAQEST